MACLLQCLTGFGDYLARFLIALVFLSERKMFALRWGCRAAPGDYLSFSVWWLLPARDALDLSCSGVLIAGLLTLCFCALS